MALLLALEALTLSTSPPLGPRWEHEETLTNHKCSDTAAPADAVSLSHPGPTFAEAAPAVVAPPLPPPLGASSPPPLLSHLPTSRPLGAPRCGVAFESPWARSCVAYDASNRLGELAATAVAQCGPGAVGILQQWAQRAPKKRAPALAGLLAV